MAEKSKLRKMLSEGCIGEYYTLNGYFLKIYPCLEIDKVKFSFVEKGKKGSGFDVYVGTDRFSILCDDILNWRLGRKIRDDNGKYPGAWKYATGENASRELAIGKSQKGGIVIQGRDKTANRNAFVPIADYDELRTLAVWYGRVSGKTPVYGYYAELCDLFREGAARSSSFHKQDNGPSGPPPEVRGDAVLELTARPGSRLKGSVYYLPVTAGDGTAYVLRVDRDVFDGGLPGKFGMFVEKTSNRNVAFNALCGFAENGLVFRKFARSAEKR